MVLVRASRHPDWRPTLTIGSVSRTTGTVPFVPVVEPGKNEPCRSFLIRSIEVGAVKARPKGAEDLDRASDATDSMARLVADSEAVPSSASHGATHGPSFWERRTTPWKHREAIINGIRIHYVEAEPSRQVKSPLGDADGPTEAAGQSSAEPTSSTLPLAQQQQRPLLVLLHGFPEFYFSWRYQIPAFASAGYRVVAPDLRGYNLSEKPTAGYTLNTLVEDVRQLIVHVTNDNPLSQRYKSSYASKNYQETDVFLMGHDWGGVIASAVAARYPTLVSKVVLVEAVHLTALENARLQKAAPPHSRITSIGNIIRFCPPVLPELLLSYNRSWLLSNLFGPASPAHRGESHTATSPCAFPSESTCCATSTPPPHSTTSPAWEDELYRDAMSQPGAVPCMLAYFRYLPSSLRQCRADDKIQCPVMVVWGADRDSPNDDGISTAKAHVDCLQLTCDLPVELFVIPRSSKASSSHWIHQDESEQVNRCVLQFLKTRGVMRRKIRGAARDVSPR